MSKLVPQLPDLVTQINAEHAQARSAFRKGLDHAVACGKLLIRAKNSLPHGQWLPWLEEHCPDISERLAQRYMRVARDMPRIDTTNPTRVSDLSLHQALELLRASASMWRNRLLSGPRPTARAATGSSAQAKARNTK